MAVNLACQEEARLHRQIAPTSRQWRRLKTPGWEKWFGRKELEKLLARHCSKVSSRPISYWEDVAPDGLFLAWLAER